MESSRPEATRKLAERIVSIGPEALDETVLVRARQLFLDGLAVALAGTVQERPPRMIAEHVRELGGAASSSVIGFGFRTSPVQAAYVNGSSMHVLDFEPMWSPANHQLSTQLPAALALAEHLGQDGRTIALAMVKGIETMGWIRQAAWQSAPDLVRFHTPGLVGPLGAAVAAGQMLELGAEQLANALGLAASRTGSLMANAGTDTKSTHCGLAASLGLDAAMLASRGFTANTEALEHERGYVAIYHGHEHFRYELLEQFGPPFRVVSPGYAIKMFPSQYGTHFVITAALALHARIDDPSRIRSVHITVPTMPYVNRPRPATGLDGKFSFQYTTASALLDGRVKMDTFEDTMRFRPAIEALLDCTEVTMSEAIPATFEHMHVIIKVELDDGTVLEERCAGPKGKYGTPPVPKDAHLVKVRDCLRLALPEPAIEDVIGLASRLETLSAEEVKSLLAILRL